MAQATDIEKYKPQGEVVIYQTDEGKASVDVLLENETVWLSQDQIAALYDRDRSVIAKHIRNIFQEGELNESLVCAKFAQPKKYGRRYAQTHGFRTDL